MEEQPQGRWLTTAAVAAAAGYSVQQVRDLADLGVIGVATRSANGYRRFTAAHVEELGAYRDLAVAVGAVRARHAMRRIRSGDAGEGVALICRLAAELGDERERALAARGALASIHAEQAHDAEPAAGDTLTITELARALGVRASTLRFWEHEGLLSPERIETRAGTARRYPVPAVREARIVAALRAGGHPVPQVRAALSAIRDLGEVGESLAALGARLDQLTARMLALLRAGSVLARIIAAQKN